MEYNRKKKNLFICISFKVVEALVRSNSVGLKKLSP